MKINIVFDGPPGPDPGRFVEVEDTDGNGVGVGEWMQHPRRNIPRRMSDPLRNWWVLQLEVPDDTVQR